MAIYPKSETDRRVAAPDLLAVTTAIFARCGMDKADAALLAETLIHADQRGVHSHGVLRILDYVKKLTGQGAKFIADYRKKYGAPQAYTAYAYDAAGIAVEAIKRCADGGSVTRKCVVKELFATKDYSGALGTFSMTDTGDTTLTVLSGLEVRHGQWAFARAIDAGKGDA